MTRWIKMPGPGQYRGEGEWRRIEDVEDANSAEELAAAWKWNRDIGWLPTHEGDEPPAEEVRS